MPTPPASRRIRPLRRLLAGAHPALPGPIDALAERWAALAPRVRTGRVLLAVLGAVLASGVRVRAAEARWGGAPVTALVAVADLPVGSPAVGLRRVRLPPDALPARAVTAVPAGAVLTLALPEGAALTAAHLDPTGPAAGLPPGLRALPVPVEEAWGIVAGALVDVWVLGADGSTLPAARARPVLEVRGEGGERTALLGLAVDEVTAVTGGLGQGRVLLAHAPVPRATP
jgi:hypothetical protein